jgi:DNA-formamidopyrimidine glycosylase
MPEIIDLEVARKNILRKVQNQIVSNVEINSPKVLQNVTKEELLDSLIGAELSDIKRVSKVLIFQFNRHGSQKDENDYTGGLKLVVHLMLHGDFCWRNHLINKKLDKSMSSNGGEEQTEQNKKVENNRKNIQRVMFNPNDTKGNSNTDKNARQQANNARAKKQVDGDEEKNVVCALSFDNKQTVLIKDWSKWMKLEIEDEQKDLQSALLRKDYGVDPLSEQFNIRKLKEILDRRSRAGIKSVLMDQEEIAGLGNAYTDEILWDARIDPRTKSGKLVENHIVENLYSSIKDVLSKSLDIVMDLSAKQEISEQERDFMKVYRKAGQTCPAKDCEEKIKKIKVVGRSTHICEKCQKHYK